MEKHFEDVAQGRLVELKCTVVHGVCETCLQHGQRDLGNWVWYKYREFSYGCWR